MAGPGSPSTKGESAVRESPQTSNEQRSGPLPSAPRGEVGVWGRLSHWRPGPHPSGPARSPRRPLCVRSADVVLAPGGACAHVMAPRVTGGGGRGGRRRPGPRPPDASRAPRRTPGARLDIGPWREVRRGRLGPGWLQPRVWVPARRGARERQRDGARPDRRQRYQRPPAPARASGRGRAASGRARRRAGREGRRARRRRRRRRR